MAIIIIIIIIPRRRGYESSSERSKEEQQSSAQRLGAAEPSAAVKQHEMSTCPTLSGAVSARSVNSRAICRPRDTNTDGRDCHYMRVPLVGGINLIILVLGARSVFTPYVIRGTHFILFPLIGVGIKQCSNPSVRLSVCLSICPMPLEVEVTETGGHIV